MDNRFENFTISILKLNKLIHKIKLHEMTEYGLKAIHVMCLYYLDKQQSALTSSELARLTLEDKAAISRAVALLSEKGYITYVSNGYNSPIALTEEGRAVARAIDEKADNAVKAGSERLTDEQSAEMRLYLTHVADNLEKYYRKISEK